MGLPFFRTDLIGSDVVDTGGGIVVLTIIMGVIDKGFGNFVVVAGGNQTVLSLGLGESSCESRSPEDQKH